MRTEVILTFLSAVLIGALGATRNGEQYYGHQVWRASINSTADLAFIEEFLEENVRDVWKMSRQEADFRVPVDKISSFRQELRSNNIEFEVLIEDVGKLIVTQMSVKESPYNPKAQSEENIFALDKYHSFEHIITYLDFLALQNPFVTTEIIGHTFQSRQIKMIKLATSNHTVKPAIWMDCGIHAREWISPATCFWLLNHLLSNYDSDEDVTTLLDRYDLYMVPVLNPDGYDYTWNKNGDRMWRKNRQKYSFNECDGVDLNRNYGNGSFGKFSTTKDSCDETYHGPSEFSELETQVVRDTVTRILDSTTISAFFNVHSYSQLWMFPYASRPELPQESDEMYRVSQAGLDAILATNGIVYENGPAATTIYQASGTEQDWAYTGAGIVHSYIVELRDKGEFGFILPEDQIIPTATEVWNGFISAILAI